MLKQNHLQFRVIFEIEAFARSFFFFFSFVHIELFYLILESNLFTHCSRRLTKNYFKREIFSENCFFLLSANKRFVFLFEWMWVLKKKTFLFDCVLLASSSVCFFFFFKYIFIETSRASLTLRFFSRLENNCNKRKCSKTKCSFAPYFLLSNISFFLNLEWHEKFTTSYMFQIMESLWVSTSNLQVFPNQSSKETHFGKIQDPFHFDWKMYDH